MDKAAVRRAARDYKSKPGNGAGGSLHIVLDDGNIEDEHIRFCIRYAGERGDPDGVMLGQLMLRLSKEDRLWVYETH